MKDSKYKQIEIILNWYYFAMRMEIETREDITKDTVKMIKSIYN